ncbi:MAG: hypothetical protein ACR2O1_13195 [Boseongicola sp.]
MIWRAAAVLTALFCAGASTAQQSCAKGDGEWVMRACYDEPRKQGFYGHDILGGTAEWTRLEISLGPKGRAAEWSGEKRVLAVRQPDDHIFEDVAPRIVQLDGSGPPEVISVDTAFDLGARLTVLNLETGRLAATPYIGRQNRWLAPVGAADLDGDGRFEIAYIDRPHLAKWLLIWRYDRGTLRFVAQHEDVTNHRIGERDIAGGIRDCGDGPEMIVADAAWQNVLAVRFDGTSFGQRILGVHDGRSSFADAMACRN